MNLYKYKFEILIIPNLKLALFDPKRQSSHVIDCFNKTFICFYMTVNPHAIGGICEGNPFQYD